MLLAFLAYAPFLTSGEEGFQSFSTNWPGGLFHKLICSNHHPQCLLFVCTCVHLCACMLQCPQKRGLDSLELELQACVCCPPWVLGPGLCSSRTTTNYSEPSLVRCKLSPPFCSPPSPCLPHSHSVLSPLLLLSLRLHSLTGCPGTH